jgi:hypothetical protein
MFQPKNLHSRSTLKNLKHTARMLYWRLFRHGSPSFFIVGAQKAGTTSLADLLVQHSKVSMGLEKELRFFNLDYHYKKGKAYYESMFPIRRADKGGILHSFEATPEYLYYPQVAARIHSMFPIAKIVILLRDPVARAYSGWNMFCDYRQQGKLHPFFASPITDEQKALRDLYFIGELPTFSELIDLELSEIEDCGTCLEPSMIRRGIYYDQVLRYFELFGRENVHVAFLEEMSAKPEDELGGVCHFLGLNADELNLSLPKGNARSYSSKISENEAARLKAFYRPHDEKLIELLGRGLPWS